MVDQHIALYCSPVSSPGRVVVAADQPVDNADRLRSSNRTVRAEAAIRVTLECSLQRLDSFLGIAADSRIVRE
ncbi:hypothetical protein D3C74_383440 [compost metagenome]